MVRRRVDGDLIKLLLDPHHVWRPGPLNRRHECRSQSRRVSADGQGTWHPLNVKDPRSVERNVERHYRTQECELAAILCLLDVPSLLRCQQVNRIMSQLARSKHVWLALAADLQARGFIDVDVLSQDFRAQCLSQDIIQHIKGIVVGPETWSRTTAPPTVRRTLSIGLEEAAQINSPRLLAGGRFLLVERTSRARRRWELYSVLRGSKIWERANTCSFYMAIKVCSGARSVIIASCDGPPTALGITPGQRSLSLEITSVDEEGNTTVLFEYRFPRLYLAIHDLALDDDDGITLAAYVEYLIPNERREFRTGHGLLLLRPSPAVSSAGTFLLTRHPNLLRKDFIHGHFIGLKWHPAGPQICLFRMRQMKCDLSWAPISFTALVTATLSPADFSADCIVLETLPSSTVTKVDCILQVHENVLRSDRAYLISMFIGSSPQPTSVVASEKRPIEVEGYPLYRRYELVFPSNESETLSCQWRPIRPRNSVALPPIHFLALRSLTYAGYGLCAPQRPSQSHGLSPSALDCEASKEQGIWSAPSGEFVSSDSSLSWPPMRQCDFTGWERWRFEAKCCACNTAALSPYTGALVKCVEGGVDITYYY
uniref:F-box domain-containing protein n=1 Tax=Mycena chlorophos TaxID=658473 RepID=A0ABQ0M5B0_MYCCL|nr:predicted protein [Mycena chlorophos]